MQVRFAQKVAKSIDIELEIVHVKDGKHNRFGYLDAVSAYLTPEKRPDLVLGIFYLNGERAFLELIEKEKIAFFSVNSSLSRQVLKKIGKPRERFKNWIAHISPNDYSAGYNLAKKLLVPFKGRSVMMAIAGENQAATSFNREKGLLNAQSKFGFVLFPSIHTDWGPEQAYSATERVFSRFDDVNTIWTVGSSSAEGVLKYFDEHPERDTGPIIGTFDFTPAVLENIERGRIFATYGGHFKEAGWALILATDYLAGFDFKQEAGVYLETPLELVTRENAAAVARNIKQNWRDVDFKQYQKCRNPNLKGYSFLENQ